MKPTAAPPHFPYTAKDGHRTMAEAPIQSGRPQTVMKRWWPTEFQKLRDQRLLEQQRARVGMLCNFGKRRAAG